MGVALVNQKFNFDELGGVHVYPVFEHTKDGLLISHWHEDLELVYTVFGASQHFINGEVYNAEAGQLLVINSNFVHSVIPHPVEETDISPNALVIIVSKSILDASFPQFNDIYFTNSSPIVTTEIADIMEKLFQCTDDAVSNTYMILYRTALVFELLSHLARDRSVPRSRNMGQESIKYVDDIKKIITYIDNNYQEHITRSDAAKELHLSQSYFSTYFKRCMGITFTQYLTEYRLSKARELLLSTNKPISEVASSCGFYDDRGLIVAFKQKFNTTPLQFRKYHTKT